MIDERLRRDLRAWLAAPEDCAPRGRLEGARRRLGRLPSQLAPPDRIPELVSLLARFPDSRCLLDLILPGLGLRELEGLPPGTLVPKDLEVLGLGQAGNCWYDLETGWPLRVETVQGTECLLLPPLDAFEVGLRLCYVARRPWSLESASGESLDCHTALRRCRDQGGVLPGLSWVRALEGWSRAWRRLQFARRGAPREIPPPRPAESFVTPVGHIVNPAYPGEWVQRDGEEPELHRFENEVAIGTQEAGDARLCIELPSPDPASSAGGTGAMRLLPLSRPIQEENRVPGPAALYSVLPSRRAEAPPGVPLVWLDEDRLLCLRDWRQPLVWTRSAPSTRTLGPPAARALGEVVVSADQRSLLGVDDRGSLYLLDLGSEEVLTRPGFGRLVRMHAFSPVDRRAAVLFADGSLELLDLRSGQVNWASPGPGDPGEGRGPESAVPSRQPWIRFSSDGSRLLGRRTARDGAGRWDCSSGVWQYLDPGPPDLPELGLRDGEEILELKSGADHSWSAWKVGPDTRPAEHRWIFFHGHQRTGSIGDLGIPTLVRKTVDGQYRVLLDRIVHSIEVDPDRTWSWSRPRWLEGVLGRACVSPGGRWLAFGIRHSTSLVDLESGEAQGAALEGARHSRQTDHVQIAISRNGDRVTATASRAGDGERARYRLARGVVSVASRTSCSPYFVALALDPDGEHECRAMRLEVAETRWAIGTEVRATSLPGRAGVEAMAYRERPSKSLAVLDGSGALWLKALDQVSWTRLVSGDRATRVGLAAASRDGECFAFLDLTSRRIRVLRSSGPGPAVVEREPGSTVLALAVGPDHVAWRDEAGAVVVAPLAPGQALRRFDPPVPGAFVAVPLTLGRRWLAIAWGDGEVVLHDLQDPGRVIVLRDRGEPVGGLALSGDESRLVAVWSDLSILAWDLAEVAGEPGGAPVHQDSRSPSGIENRDRSLDESGVALGGS